MTPITPAVTPPPPVRKRHGCLITALVVVGVLLLVAVAAGVYATTFAKPKDLGVTYTEADYQTAVADLGIQVADTAPNVPVVETKMVYRGKKKVNVKLSSAQVSAAVSLHHRSPKWALQDVQILLGDNDQFEMSGYAVFNGQRYPFYSALTFGLASPQTVTGSAQQVVVFGVDFPQQYYEAATSYLTGVTNDWLAGMGQGLDVQSASITGGQFVLVGTVPATAERVPLSAASSGTPAPTATP